MRHMDGLADVSQIASLPVYIATIFLHVAIFHHIVGPYSINISFMQRPIQPSFGRVKAVVDSRNMGGWVVER